MNSNLLARGDPSLRVPLLVRGVPGGNFQTVRFRLRRGMTRSKRSLPVEPWKWRLHVMRITWSSSSHRGASSATKYFTWVSMMRLHGSTCPLD